MHYPGESQIVCLPTASLDHGLYARASESYRGETRFDFTERLMEDDKGVEYLHYDQVLAFLTVTNISTCVKSNWAVVQPFEEVWQLVLPPKTNPTARACVERVRARLTSKAFNRCSDDGSRRLGRPYVVRDPYQRRFVLVHAEALICAAHLIQDFATTD